MDLNPDGPYSPESVRATAALAGECARVLNRATRDHAALEYPSDLDAVTASLAILASRLPQLLGQLADWLDAEQHAGRLTAEHGKFAGRPGLAAEVIRMRFEAAAARARDLHAALDGAHQVTAALGRQGQ